MSRPRRQGHEVALLGGPVLGVVGLRGPDALPLEFSHGLVPAEAPGAKRAGMGDHGHAPGLSDPGDSLGRAQFCPGHEAGAVVADESLEGLRGAADARVRTSALAKWARESRGGVGLGLDFLLGDRTAQLGQPMIMRRFRSPGARAIPPAVPGTGIHRVHEQPQHVEGPLHEPAAQFDARHQQRAPSPGCMARKARKAGQGVMVREGQGRETRLVPSQGQGLGRVGAVGEGWVWQWRSIMGRTGLLLAR